MRTDPSTSRPSSSGPARPASPPGTTSSGPAGRSSSSTARAGSATAGDSSGTACGCSPRRWADGLPGMPFPGAALVVPDQGRVRGLPGVVCRDLRPAPGAPASRGSTGDAPRRRLHRHTRRGARSTSTTSSSAPGPSGGHRTCPASPTSSTRRSGSCTRASTDDRRSCADGPVLVVGASHSGCDIAYEARRDAPDGAVSGPDTGQIPVPFDSPLFKVVFPTMLFVFRNVLTRTNPIGRKAQAHFRHGGPAASGPGARPRRARSRLGPVGHVAGTRRRQAAARRRSRGRRPDRRVVHRVPSGVRLGRGAGVRADGWPRRAARRGRRGARPVLLRHPVPVRRVRRCSSRAPAATPRTSLAGSCRATASRSPGRRPRACPRPRDRGPPEPRPGDRHARILRTRRMRWSSPADLVEGREAFDAPGLGHGVRAAVARSGSPTWPPRTCGSLATAAYLVGDRDVTTEAPGAVLPPKPGRGRTAGRGARRDLAGLRLHRLTAVPPSARAGPRRALRLLESMPEDQVERGYLRVHEMMRHVYAGSSRSRSGSRPRSWRPASGGTTATSPRWVFRLAAGCCCTPGRCAQGLALLDEAMLRVTGGEVSPILTGEIVCSMIEACQEIADYRRIGDWTAITDPLVRTQPDLVPFTGQCAVHRAQVLRLQGAYAEALERARARQRALRRQGLAAGSRAGPLRAGRGAAGPGRLRRCESAYDEARALRARAQPGLSLLWLARGRTAAAAVATMRRQLDETHEPVARARCCPRRSRCSSPWTRSRRLERLRTSSTRLARAVRLRGGVGAGALRRRESVLLAGRRGAAAEALPHLRRAWKPWIDLGARYEAARRGCRWRSPCGRWATRTPRSPSSAWPSGPSPRSGRTRREEEARRLQSRALPDGLTAREVEVLRLVAVGHSNPQIAAALFLSHKTVQRHLSNIFAKTGVTSRTAAAAYAFEHRLA